MEFYDPGTRQIRWLVVTSGGTVFNGINYKESGVWKSKATGTQADGTRIESDLKLNITDDGDTHAWRGTVKVGGKATDPIKDVWRRVSKP